jgi:ribosomal protein L37AE/L43A
MSEMFELGLHPSQAEVEGPRERPHCPHCDRVVSDREAIEQGACNDCCGGAWEGPGGPDRGGF